MPQILPYIDRVREITSTTGTGTITLAGAKPAHRGFLFVGDENVVSYCITDGTDFEVGEGTYAFSGTTLSRDVVYSSSNGNNLVNFGAGFKDVILIVSAKSLTAINIEDTFVSAEPISGGRAVAKDQSGAIQIAMASVSGRMPAIGVVVDNIASGLSTRIYERGKITSTLFNFSGYIGGPFWVGTSGEIIVSAAPTLSGNVQQVLGVINSHSGLFLTCNTISGSITTSGSIASGSIGQFHLASGAVNSGHIGSGAITGSLSTGADCIASGTIGPFDLGSGAILSGAIASGQIGINHLGSGVVISGDVASGQIGINHLGIGAVASGDVASGSIGQFHLASGAVNSGHISSGSVIGSLSTGADCIASGTIGPFDLGSGAILSGAIASGQIGINHLGDGAVASGDVASGSVARFHLASGAVNSGQMASGAIVGVIVAGSRIASGTIGPNDLGSGAIRSGTINSGVVGLNAFGNNSVNSGAVGSGAVTRFKLASGCTNSGQTGSGFVATFDRQTIEDTWTAAENLNSGLCAVTFESGGGIVVAQGASGLRMPAFGVSDRTIVASGGAVNVIMWGRLMMVSGMNAMFSGQQGRPLYVSTSGGLITATKPDAGLCQLIGVAVSGGIIVQPELTLQSGNLAIQSGG